MLLISSVSCALLCTSGNIIQNLVLGNKKNSRENGSSCVVVDRGIEPLKTKDNIRNIYY